MDQTSIIRDFDTHIGRSHCQFYNQLYVGITDNVEHRLFDEHNVSHDKQWWIYSPADTEDVARAVERHYLDLGMRGNLEEGSGNGNSRYVYCYVIAPNTVE